MRKKLPGKEVSMVCSSVTEYSVNIFTGIGLEGDSVIREFWITDLAQRLVDSQIGVN